MNCAAAENVPVGTDKRRWLDRSPDTERRADRGYLRTHRCPPHSSCLHGPTKSALCHRSWCHALARPDVTEMVDWA